ncbi:MAG: M23 family metallopeptidase [Candidatus Muiribacteriota bacterium]
MKHYFPYFIFRQKKKFFLKNICILFVLISPVFLQSKENPLFIIENFNEISSTFGEYRGNSLHKGIDIPTNGKTGYKVFAFDDGYIFRVLYSWTGYGKAIYIRHPEKNLVSVYAHLQKFENDKLLLEDIIKGKRKRNLRNHFNFYPSPPIKVKKGQLIAYSGDTGFGYPHLHFELRSLDNQKILNPIAHFNIKNSISPQFERVTVLPAKNNSFINKKATNQTIPLNRIRDDFYVSKNTLEFIPGSKVCFSAMIFDKFIEDSHNKLGIYSLELYHNNEKKYSLKFDSLPLFEQRGLKFFEYENTNLGPTKYDYRFYNPDSGEGFIELHKKSKSIKLVVSDFHNNKTVALIDLVAQKEQKKLPDPLYNLKGEMEVKKNLHYYDNHISLEISPSLSLKEKPYIIYEGKKYYSIFDKIKSFNFSLPYKNDFPEASLHLTDFKGKNYIKKFELESFNIERGINYKDFKITSKQNDFFSIKTGKNSHKKAQSNTLTIYPENKFINKVLNIKFPLKKICTQTSFYYLNITKNEWEFLESKKTENYLKVETKKTGSYSLIKDDIPPEIILRLAGNRLIADFSDNLSGIDYKSIRVFVNNIPVLFDYDITRGRINMPLIYDGREELHIEVSARDKQGNISIETIKATKK